MSSGMRAAMFVGALAFAGGALAQGAPKKLEQYDLIKQSRPAYEAFRKAVPSEFRRVSWVYDLKSTTGPLYEAKIGGKTYYGQFVCKPHDCGDNQFHYLAAADGSRAIGWMKTPGGGRTFGDPTAEEIALLRAME